MRDAIWDAAIDLFAEKGFDATTVEDIARAAGTSRRSFFRYFASKSDLMTQPIVSYGEFLTETIRDCPSDLPPAEVVRYVVLKVVRESAAHPRARKTMEIAEKYPAAMEAQMARIAGIQDKVEQAFAQRRRGGKEELAVHILASLTLSILSATFRAWFKGNPKDISIAAEQVFTTVAGIACELSRSGKARGPAAKPAGRIRER